MERSSRCKSIQTANLALTKNECTTLAHPLLIKDHPGQSSDNVTSSKLNPTREPTARILIVEADSGMSELLARTLRRAAYQAEIAPDGDAALEISRTDS